MVTRAGADLKALAAAVYPPEYTPVIAGAGANKSRAPAKRKTGEDAGEDGEAAAAGAKRIKATVGGDGEPLPLTKDAINDLLSKGMVRGDAVRPN